MEALTLAAAFALGAMVGSFLNVCIVRLPADESIAFPASHCRSCKAPIAWHDNVPVLSWFVLGGKCRRCKAKFSAKYPAVEFATGCLFVLFVATFGLTAKTAVYLVFACALVVETMIDFEHRIIPDEITIPGFFLGLAAAAAFPQWLGPAAGFSRFFASLSELSASAPPAARVLAWVSAGLGRTGWFSALFQALFGALVGGGFLWLSGTIAERILKKEAMGGGDVKLLAMIGTLVGWPGVLWTVFVSSLLGSVVGLYQRFKSGEAYIPYGPYLGMAALLYLFVGHAAVRWYFERLTSV